MQKKKILKARISNSFSLWPNLKNSIHSVFTLRLQKSLLFQSKYWPLVSNANNVIEKRYTSLMKQKVYPF